MASNKSKLIKKGPNPITKTSPITEKTDSRTDRSDDVYNNLVTLARRGVFVSGGRLPVRALEGKLAFFQAMGPELSYPETPCAQLPFHLNPDNWDPDTLGAFEPKTEKPEVKMECLFEA